MNWMMDKKKQTEADFISAYLAKWMTYHTVEFHK